METALNYEGKRKWFVNISLNGLKNRNKSILLYTTSCCFAAKVDKLGAFFSTIASKLPILCAFFMQLCLIWLYRLGIQIEQF